MDGNRDTEALLDHLELTEYEAQALERLLRDGKTTAPNLSEATGIPKARIYGVLDGLADRGFVKVIPGRPKHYQPKAPDEILDEAVEHQRQSFESYRQTIDEVRPEFVETFQPLYEAADDDVTPTEELFHVVDVGDPSERATRSLYHEADERVCVITKSFEYFESVRPAFEDALKAGCEVEVLFLHPDHLSAENAEIQREIVAEIQAEYPEVDCRFSEERLPWRGTIADPSMDYERGQAILLVEEEDIPLHKRQAAVTENASFVAGLFRFFQLSWEYESVETYPLD